MKRRLLITQRLPVRVVTKARETFDVTERGETGPLGEDDAARALKDFDVVVPTLGDAFRGAAFDDGPFRAKGLANFGVGYNHIDVAKAKGAGLVVSNTPGAVTDATADIAMTLILMACRRASEGEMLVRTGQWHGWAPTQLLGMHVSGKTVGIVGMGRIGKAIAKRCHGGFGMKVVFFNRSPVRDPGVPAVQLETLRDVLETADIVVLAVPATPETRHIIDAEELRAIGPKSYLINIARGDVIDETALVDALTGGVIAGAGLDVYENEPRLAPGLIDCPNVTLLPHLGTAALEVREAMGFMALENAIAIAEGREPPNLV